MIDYRSEVLVGDQTIPGNKTQQQSRPLLDLVNPQPKSQKKILYARLHHVSANRRNRLPRVIRNRKFNIGDY